MNKTILNKQIPLDTSLLESKLNITGVKSIHRACDDLLNKYSSVLQINPVLTREIVSHQGNKKLPFYRWLKFKEAYSVNLVKYFLDLYHPQNKKCPTIIDPFSGIGTTLTVAASEGWKATGIEIMPVGIAAIKARISANKINKLKFEGVLRKFKRAKNSNKSAGRHFNYLKITDRAFPCDTEREIKIYEEFVENIKDEDIRYVFWFACLTVLEEISFTRKDGQYLRWDYRSNRNLKSKFHKGPILSFKEAINNKLSEIKDDIDMNLPSARLESVNIIEGSCLDEMPRFPGNKFSMIMTSPPYCNRYDYTRTYALELAFIGKNDAELKDLRQAMLSCTVENKSKVAALESYYAAMGETDTFQRAHKRFQNHRALREVLSNLNRAKINCELNNDNIPGLVENYFYEMNILISEFYRTLKVDGRVIMVNDNVQYNGSEIPVDLILSDLAQQEGFIVEHIWVLPKGKGNSSQQMGLHGRKELRKCVYVWKKEMNLKGDKDYRA